MNKPKHKNKHLKQTKQKWQNRKKNDRWETWNYVLWTRCSFVLKDRERYAELVIKGVRWCNTSMMVVWDHDRCRCICPSFSVCHSDSEPQSGTCTGEIMPEMSLRCRGPTGDRRPMDPLHIICKVCVVCVSSILLCSPSRASKALRRTDGHLFIFYFS